MNWCGFIDLLRASEGVAAGLGIVLSFAAEWWPAFVDLSSQKKRVLVLLVCVAIPMLATVGGYFSRCIEALDRETVWQAVYIGGIVFGASQFAHARNLA